MYCTKSRLSLSFYKFVSVYRSQVSTWSSGAGAAGVVGALSYAGLTALRVSPQTTLLIMIVVPCLLLLTSVFLLASLCGFDLPQVG